MIKADDKEQTTSKVNTKIATKRKIILILTRFTGKLHLVLEDEQKGIKTRRKGNCL